MKVLGLSQGLDGHQFSPAQNACRFHVFVDESLHREHQLVVKRRHGFFRQAANVELQRIGPSAQPADQLSTENGSHAGR